MVPSKETIEYGRRVVQKQIDLIDAWLNGTSPAQGIKARPPSTGDQRERQRFARFMLQRLLGDEGCVIGPFDRRWLEDDFRVMMTEVRDSL